MSAPYSECDAAIASSAGPARGSSHPSWLLLTTILASGLALVDGSVTNVALAPIRASFGADAAVLQWMVNAYLLPLSALLLLGGAAGDRYGHTLLLIVGVSIFGVASVACALAPSITWLLAARGLQGVGSALLMPNSLALLGDHYSGSARGRAIGIWASAGAAMAALGPLLGGYLIDTVGWRWIFFINVPTAAVAIALAVAFIHDRPPKAPLQEIDVLGGVLATAALGALTWGFTIGSGVKGWSRETILWIAAGAALMTAFLTVEKSKKDAAMTPLSLFGSPSFVGITLLTLLLYGALGAFLVLVPYLLIQAGGYSGTQSGAALLPFAIVLTAASPLMGALAGRIGPRIPLIVGPLVTAGGFLLILRTTQEARYWSQVFPAIMVIATGMSGAVAPLTTAVFASVDSQHRGSASGFNSAIARAGGLVATALLGGVLGTTGPQLVAGFRVTGILCALASAAATLCAFLISVDHPEPRS